MTRQKHRVTGLLRPHIWRLPRGCLVKLECMHGADYRRLHVMYHKLQTNTQSAHRVTTVVWRCVIGMHTTRMTAGATVTRNPSCNESRHSCHEFTCINHRLLHSVHMTAQHTSLLGMHTYPCTHTRIAIPFRHLHCPPQLPALQRHLLVLWAHDIAALAQSVAAGAAVLLPAMPCAGATAADADAA